MFLAIGALAACAEGEQVTEPPEDVDVGGIGGPVAGTLQNNAAAPEDERATWQWFARTTATGSWAGYGPPNSEAVFSVRCEDDRLVFNTTEMPRSGAGPTEMRLSAAGVEQTVSAEASEEGLPSTDASVPADAEWLSPLAAASGNLSVSVGGSDALVVPNGEPMESVIRECGR